MSAGRLPPSSFFLLLPPSSFVLLLPPSFLFVSSFISSFFSYPFLCLCSSSTLPFLFPFPLLFLALFCSYIFLHRLYRYNIIQYTTIDTPKKNSPKIKNAIPCCLFFDQGNTMTFDRSSYIHRLYIMYIYIHMYVHIYIYIYIYIDVQSFSLVTHLGLQYNI